MAGCRKFCECLIPCLKLIRVYINFHSYNCLRYWLITNTLFRHAPRREPNSNPTP